MATQFDASEFVDRDFEVARQTGLQPTAMSTASAPNEPGRAPTREEVDNRVADMQQRLGELKRAQAELERERATLEETRRRQTEFITGREEMISHLTRGVSLLQETEFAARRDAEQMAKTLADLREALQKVQDIQDQSWSRENFQVELTRANAIIENARMEWNSARLKFPLLSGNTADGLATAPAPEPTAWRWTDLGFFELCRVGLALTWPIAVAAVAIVVVLLLRR